ncbi:CPBP family intramembrane glutamic endopeptidase [Woodsholea maritima]|uniref:CPBP family intramembrane glutamic endopeptidase n=1 Tax=Woodsholea maritima TaxID=240237 RepID=UPI00036C4AD5|nr:CPBP family intramembrane glutamic endopeptidase [Woodsholea maritima]
MQTSNTDLIDDAPRFGLYARVERWRRTYGWASLLLLLAGYFLSSVFAGLFAGIYYGIHTAMAGSLEAGAPGGAGLGGAMLTDPHFLLPMLALQFVFWGGFTLIWLSVFERRGLKSIGFSDGVLWRYGRGVGVALIAVIVLSVLGAIASALGFDMGKGSELADAAGEVDPSVMASLLRPGVLIGLALVLVLFLFQGAVEEIVFRGWLLSALDARWGRIAAIIVSTILFAILHAQHLQNDLVLGLASIVAIGIMGLFLTLYAVGERSIAGVAGMHGAFNGLIMIVGILGALSTNPEQSVVEAFMATLNPSAGLGNGAEQIPMIGAVIQGGTFLILCALPVFGILRRKTHIEA